MLVTLLTAFGAMVGRNSFISVGAARHHPRVFALMVGKTGSGRKGTALEAVRPILKAAGSDSVEFFRRREMKGLASGEGLVAGMSRMSASNTLDPWTGAGPVDDRAL